MTKKKFPVIRLTAVSTKGRHYGAFESEDEAAKMGYDIFLPDTANQKPTCECMAFVHGDPCYHITESKKLDERLFG